MLQSPADVLKPVTADLNSRSFCGGRARTTKCKRLLNHAPPKKRYHDSKCAEPRPKVICRASTLRSNAKIRVEECHMPLSNCVLLPSPEARGSTLWGPSRGPLPPRGSTLFASFKAPKLPNCVSRDAGVHFSEASGPKAPKSVLLRVAPGPSPKKARGSKFSEASGPKAPEKCTPPRGSGPSPRS